MYNNPFEREKRKFRNLASRVNHLLISKEWENLSVNTRNYLIRKLNTLYSKLSRFFSSAELGKILAAAALFIAFPMVSKSQTFDPPVQNPFGFTPPASEFAKPVFADIDNDEDLDLLLGDYGGNIHFYENTGTSAAPAFGPGQPNPFGLTSNDYLAFPAVADIDNDGDVDLFVGGYEGSILFFENTGTVTTPAFAAPQPNPFGIIPPSGFAIPAFADIDGDGDLDLFAGEYEGNMKFFENTGTIAQPHFAAPVMNPFGLSAVLYVGTPAFADLDHDGDLDLLVGEMYGNTRYFKNNGTPQSPAFASPITNPFGIVPVNYYCFPAFADMDNDGDLDLMTGELESNLQYFENTEINIGLSDQELPEKLVLFPNPASDEVFLQINFPDRSASLVFKIFNNAGKIIKSGEINLQNLRINTSDLSAGIYTVQLTSGDKTHTGKIAIE
ncbi:MAG: T9SS type A sorting domain-containing protein [Lentimicrobium sp.]